MDDSLCLLFFNQPSCPAQRQYEAIRAVFVDGLSQKDAAAHFGYSYDAFRQILHNFRHNCAAGNPPPFSTPSDADDRSLHRIHFLPYEVLHRLHLIIQLEMDHYQHEYNML